MESDGCSSINCSVFCIGKIEPEQETVHVFESNRFSFTSSRRLRDNFGDALFVRRQHIGIIPISALKCVPPFKARQLTIDAVGRTETCVRCDEG